MQYELTTPCTAQDLAPLHAGDTVLLSGVVYTARDQAHKRMLEALDRGEPLPFDLEGSAIYYVGPTPERPGAVIGSAGPTTSGRMDAMSPRLLDLGNKVMIGKGKRDAAVKEAVVRNGAVYLAALGGAGALMAKSVKTLEVIAWPDLGCEAVRRLTVEQMPLTVILDAHGGDLYLSGPEIKKGRRPTTMQIHQSAEDYLETILMLNQRMGRVRSIDVVNELGYTKASVSIAMKKLRENGYIAVDGEGNLTLLEPGREIAERIYSRHRLLTHFFVQLGVEEDVAAEDACKAEHILSEQTLEKIREYALLHDAESTLKNED